MAGPLYSDHATMYANVQGKHIFITFFSFFFKPQAHSEEFHVVFSVPSHK